ncbi:MAG: uroporphyrinogen-III C-methyltransferase [Coleofasciculaceae cyanobacterium]
MTKPRGKVYLVGAGPGELVYLTLRGQQLLSVADALVYDALVDSQLLQLVPPNCQRFDVGKRGGRPSTRQVDINQLLVEQCLQGKQVVRLKGGDPFIFGRASSEIQALTTADCCFEVVPGISSALAAPLLAGIPLTDPVLSRCFAVVSAHQPEELDWEALARINTLAILMGGRHLAEIVKRLERYGRSRQTPIAIIRAAGCPQQQVWVGTLADIVEQTAGIYLSPAVIVVGEVVGLRNYLQAPELEVEAWHNTLENINQQAKYPTNLQLANTMQPLSLKGKTILVTRSAGQSSKFRELLEREGAEVIEMPALVITPPSSWQELDDAIANLSDFDWLILTSANGVNYFFERLLSQGKDARALAQLKIAVVGKKTAASLQEHSFKPDFIPPDFVADSLVEKFPEQLPGKKVLFPRVESGGREVLVKELTAKGVIVTEVAAYQSGCPAQIAPIAKDALRQHKVDIITFASSKTVKHFVQLFEQELVTDSGNSKDVNYQLQDIGIASIGPQTSLTCHQLLSRVDVEAKEYTLEGLTEAIVEWVREN